MMNTQVKDKMLGVRMSPEMHRRFKLKVTEDGSNMQEAIIKLVGRYINDEIELM